MIDLVTEPLKRGNKEFEIFKDVVPDPPIEKISEGVKKMLEYKPDAIVAVVEDLLLILPNLSGELRCA